RPGARQARRPRRLRERGGSGAGLRGGRRRRPGERPGGSHRGRRRDAEAAGEERALTVPLPRTGRVLVPGTGTGPREAPVGTSGRVLVPGTGTGPNRAFA